METNENEILAEVDASSHHSISWDLPQTEPIEDSVLNVEREKHRARAQRFGYAYVEPGRSRPELALEAKKERLKRDGFATGFDPFSEEETKKRLDRAARFGVVSAPAMEYKPDVEIETKVKRAAKFGVKYEPSEAVLMDMDLYEERREVSCDVERRPNAVYLYGVDLMSTKDCLRYFEGFGPTFVEWINDSSCNVLFHDALSAKRAIVGIGNPLPPTEATAAAGLDPKDIQNLPFLWHKGQDFDKDSTQISLIYRMATVHDEKDIKAPRKTRELWKNDQQQPGKSRQREGLKEKQASASQFDEDGDAEMKQARGPRGGKRIRRRKTRHGADRGDGEIAIYDDVEMDEEDAEPLQVTDLREVLKPGTQQADSCVDMGPMSTLGVKVVIGSSEDT